MIRIFSQISAFAGMTIGRTQTKGTSRVLPTDRRRLAYPQWDRLAGLWPVVIGLAFVGPIRGIQTFERLALTD